MENEKSNRTFVTVLIVLGVIVAGIIGFLIAKHNIWDLSSEPNSNTALAVTSDTTLAVTSDTLSAAASDATLAKNSDTTPAKASDTTLTASSNTNPAKTAIAIPSKTAATTQKGNSTKKASPLPFEPKMVLVKGGKFWMGCSGDQGKDCDTVKSRLHQVTLSDFHIGIYVVTQGEWKALMGSNPSHFKKGDKYPVENVTWAEVQDFITKLNSATGKKYRLPTEAEWEYAARGGSISKSYKYSGSNKSAEVAWYSDNSKNSTQPVNDPSKRSNELGIHGMSGNVWEWCEDWYSPYKSSAQSNPKGPSTGIDRVARGGSWYRDATNSTVYFRNHMDPNNRYSSLGFRVVLSN